MSKDLAWERQCCAYGCEWFDTLQDCADEFLKTDKAFMPNSINVEKYKKLFSIYQEVYAHTRMLNEKLIAYRK